MAKKKQHKTLYFINGVTPTDEQQLEIDAITGLVCIRNAAKIEPGDFIEDFDFAAGEVPDAYAKVAAAKEAAASDEPAPKASTQAPAAPQQAKAGTAKPTGGAGSAWKAN